MTNADLVKSEFCKIIAVKIYKILQATIVSFSLLFKNKSDQLFVFYGGALKGDVGGPLVKVKRLNKFFPENKLRFNVVYLLSNANYLFKHSFDKIRKNNIPIILNQNGVFTPDWYGENWEKKNSIMSYAYLNSDYVFWQSNFCKKMAEKYLGKREGPGEVLFNAVDTVSTFFPSYSKRKRPFTFLITGKFGKNMYGRLENSILGIQIANSNGVTCNLIIAGWMHRNLKMKIKKLIMNKNLFSKIRIIDPFRQENALKIYHSSDAYITTKYNDSCPNSVIEAMACGLPILYSNSGGVPELVGKKAGFALDLVSENKKIFYPEPKQVFLGISEIINNHNDMKLNARSRAKLKFEIKDWISRHNIIFETFKNKK